MISVHLTRQQVLDALEIGVRRQRENDRDGLRDTRGFRGRYYEQLGMHIMGALGEAAYAALHGLRATKGEVGDGADVGRVEVKAVEKDSHSLILRQGTDPDKVCALICGRVPFYRMLGWCYARDVMVDTYIKDVGRGPQFMVPASVLTPGLVPRELR